MKLLLNTEELVKPIVVPFLDSASNTISYVVGDPISSSCAVVDTVLGFDYASGRISCAGADKIVAYIEERGWQNEWLIETHVHADHLSAAPYIQSQVGGRLGIGANITLVQETFGKIFNEGTEFQRDGSQFDRLFNEGDCYNIGSLDCCVIETPGHTPACTAHVIGDAVFVGDTLFMPDSGSARADFPGGDARTLYRSIQKIMSLPSECRLFVCHDYGSNGRDIRCKTTIGKQRADNIHVGNGRTEEEFVALREAWDAQLAMPKLIIPSLQVNMKGGRLPDEQDGKMFLKIPINVLKFTFPDILTAPNLTYATQESRCR